MVSILIGLRSLSFPKNCASYEENRGYYLIEMGTRVVHDATKQGRVDFISEKLTSERRHIFLVIRRTSSNNHLETYIKVGFLFQFFQHKIIKLKMSSVL